MRVAGTGTRPDGPLARRAVAQQQTRGVRAGVLARDDLIPARDATPARVPSAEDTGSDGAAWIHHAGSPIAIGGSASR